MSATIAVPAGLDTLSPEETRLMENMRDDAPAPAASAAPEPAPAAEPTDLDDEAPDAGDGRQKTVPHAQFHAANERRKAAEAKAAAAEQKLAVEQARLAERLDMLTRAVTATTPPAAAVEPEIPDIATDPVGHFQAQLALRDRKLAEQAAILSGMQEQTVQQRQISDLRNWGAASEMAFEAQEPSYRDAMKFLTEGRHAELEQIGITDPNERARIIGQDVANIAARTRQEGGDFAARLFAVAKARGFKATPAVPALDAAPASIPEPAARIAAGRENSTTIGSAGSAPPARLSVEKIANMPDAQFAALVGKLKGDPGAFRDLMGH